MNMAAISRREFLKKVATDTAVAGIMATSAMELHANPLGLPIGSQTYPHRAMLKQDFPGLMKQLADLGVQRIELCSPFGYADFAGLAKEVGVKQMLTATLGAGNNPTMDDVKKAADEYNKIAAVAAKAGIQQGLHNEGFEVSSVDGKRTYDILMELLDPKLVKFQFQMSTIRNGFDAAEYFMKYPGRFFSMHLQDWNAETKTLVAVGKGSIDWKRVFTAAKTGGVKNYFVEQNMELTKEGVAFLKTLKV